MNVCVRVCERERASDLENVCVDARVSVCVCEKRERVWVYVCVVVWECVDYGICPQLYYHSRRNYCCTAPSLKTWQLHACT